MYQNARPRIREFKPVRSGTLVPAVARCVVVALRTTRWDVTNFLFFFLHTEHCTVRNLGEPTWQDVSDKRGTFPFPSLPFPSLSFHPHSPLTHSSTSPHLLSSPLTHSRLPHRLVLHRPHPRRPVLRSVLVRGGEIRAGEGGCG